MKSPLIALVALAAILSVVANWIGHASGYADGKADGYALGKVNGDMAASERVQGAWVQSNKDEMRKFEALGVCTYWEIKCGGKR